MGNLVNCFRARLAMQDQNYDAREGIRIRNIRRKLFDDDEKPGNSDNSVNLVIEENKRHLEQVILILIFI